MFDYLKDIVSHTYGLGIVDLVKITGDNKETAIDALAEDRSVVVQAKLKTALPDFEGNFGMPNLSTLNTLLNIPEYKEGAQITLTKQDRDGVAVAVGLHFRNKANDFKNDYRFMAAEIINEKLKTVKFKGVSWNVEFEPSVAAIQRLKFMASANPAETVFVAKTEGTDLKFYFGDHSSHAGDFVFQPNVNGSLSKAWAWPVGAVISILSLPGDKTVRISDEGAAQITVDSGLAVYNYIIPAQSK